jgi:predicted Zn-dependent protease
MNDPARPFVPTHGRSPNRAAPVVRDPQSYFFDLTGEIAERLRGEELFTCSFSAEDSDFVRFNRNEVRQAVGVRQRFLTLDLIEGRRHAKGRLSLSEDVATDRAAVAALLGTLREMRPFLPDDPFLSTVTEGRSTERRHRGVLPERAAALARIREAGSGHDLVGFYAAGPVFKGFASSFGQRNWYANESFNLDWSFFLAGDRAVKAAYAGFEWREDELGRRVDEARRLLAVLRRPSHRLTPGRYPVFLSPAALHELVLLLGRAGFGLRAHRTKTTPLIKMVEEGARLHPSVEIAENTRDGFAPDFQEDGFARPPRVPLVARGAYAGCLVSPRSALEYGVAPNGATAAEAPVSIDLKGGDLPLAEVPARMGRGLFVGNLWYLNFSDRSACRITGMTRFATFWVENGEICAPADVMRFDDTLYRMLGANLVALTRERETILDPGTYFERSVESARLPGALIDDFILTL